MKKSIVAKDFILKIYKVKNKIIQLIFHSLFMHRKDNKKHEKQYFEKSFYNQSAVYFIVL